MASADAHRAKAEKNLRFLGIIPDEYADWLATVAFYSAVHYVQAVFARDGVSSRSHFELNQRLRRQHPDIWRQFKPLYNASRLARYTDFPINAAEVLGELIEGRLKAIRRMVAERLPRS